MADRMTTAEYRALIEPKAKRKYRNRPTIGHDGRRYASKLEAARAAELEMHKRSGLIKGWLPQVSLPAGHKRRLVVDFLVVDNDGRLRLEDAKGMATPAWTIKAEVVEAALGVPIELIKSKRRR